MHKQAFGDRYLEIRRVRLAAYAQTAKLSPQDIKDFEILEDKMNSGDLGENWLSSYHLSNDSYMPLLQKVLNAAVTTGEPHARKKLKLFIEEKGIQGPALYNAPWDMTLADLDKDIGRFDEVADFYGMSVAA